MSTRNDVVAVKDLRIAYRQGGLSARGAETEVVHGVSFELGRGETLALVGQSGSGKSTIALAVAGLLPANGRITAGTVSVSTAGGELDVTSLRQSSWQGLRGTTIGFVPQDPLSSLDPLRRVGHQIAQSLLLHNVVPRSDVAAAVVSLLDRVGVRNPQQRARAYPHELSGGQLQRVLIAIAISANPSILIADEPTSALDVTVQRTILDQLAELQSDLGLGVLFITHDLALAQERSDAIAVLNRGELKDYGSAHRVLDSPRDAYTVALLANAPALSLTKYDDRAHRPAPDAPAIIEVDKVTKFYGPAQGAPTLGAVSLSLAEGEIHALVGESGSGKTTLARVIAGLTGFSSGQVRVGDALLAQHPQLVNHNARTVQLVYQNALAAIDPRYSAARAIEEPLIINGVGNRAQRAAAVGEALDLVALPSTVLDRRPRELSGGQRQRVALARALVLAPRALVLDEPTSALDVTVQAQIIDLLLDLQEKLGLSYLLISHDLSLVRQVAHRVSVLERGTIVEYGDVRTIFDSPRHDYTAELINAIPGRRPLATVGAA